MFILEQEQNKTTKKLHKSDLLFIYTFVFGLRNDDLMEVPPAFKKKMFQKSRKITFPAC